MTLAQKMLQNNGITPKATDEIDTTKVEKVEGADGVNTDVTASANTTASGAEPQQQAADQGGSPSAASVITSDLSDDVLLEGLRKKGITVTSLQELTPKPAEVQLTAEQQAAAKVEKENQIRAFALTSGKVTSTQLDDFVRESSLPKETLAFNLFRNERVAELKADGVKDEDINEEELLTEFKEEYFQFADANDPKFKRGAKKIEAMVNEYLADKYSTVYGLEEDFNQHQTTQQKRTAYNTVVNEAVSTLKKIPFEFKDAKGVTVSIPVEFEDSEVAAAKALYEKDEMFNALGQSEVDKTSLTEAIKNSLIASNLPKILAKVATEHAAAEVAKIKLGRREQFTTVQEGQEGAKKTFPGVQKQLAQNKQNLQPA